MAIANLSQIISGLQPTQYITKAVPIGIPLPWASTWILSGIPVGGTYDPTANGSALSNPVTGQIPWFDPPSGNNAYLARLTYCCSHQGGQPATILLCDRLWHNTINATSTSLQSMTTPTWPARDENGQTNGVGVYLGLEISSTVSATAPTFTLIYTNTVGGTSTVTQTVVAANTTTVANGISFIFPLANGDFGVQAVQSIQLGTAWASGTVNLVAFRPIAGVEGTYNINNQISIDGITGALPRMYNGSVPYILYASSAAESGLNAEITYTFG
jgi:hypothetical protein